MSEEANPGSKTEQPPKECLAYCPKGQWTPNVVSMNVACKNANGRARYSMAIDNIDNAVFLSHETKGFTKQCEGLNVCLLAQMCQGRARRHGWSEIFFSPFSD